MWYFDDGFVMLSGICFFVISNFLNESCFWFWVKDKICEDNNGINLYNYICEYKCYKYRWIWYIFMVCNVNMLLVKIMCYVCIYKF